MVADVCLAATANTSTKRMKVIVNIAALVVMGLGVFTAQQANTVMATEPSAVGVVLVVMVAGVYIAHQVDTHIK